MSSIDIKKNDKLKDIIGLMYFIIAVILGTMFVNSYVFRSYSVSGRSMEDTIHDGEQLIVNRLPVTFDSLKNKTYTPERGQVIVFNNPKKIENQKDKFLVKRVIAFAGERVVNKDGTLYVYNKENPNGFDPSLDWKDKPRTPSSGDFDVIVPEGTIFVAGDHRDGNNSYDSRNGLGPVPLYDIIGPVKLRLFPITKLRFF